jgi:hypothetical protein
MPKNVNNLELPLHFCLKSGDEYISDCQKNLLYMPE